MLARDADYELPARSELAEAEGYRTASSALSVRRICGVLIGTRDCMPAGYGQDDWDAGALADVLPLFGLRRGG
jgi:hypothetical protein